MHRFCHRLIFPLFGNGHHFTFGVANGRAVTGLPVLNELSNMPSRAAHDLDHGMHLRRCLFTLLTMRAVEQGFNMGGPRAARKLPQPDMPHDRAFLHRLRQRRINFIRFLPNLPLFRLSWKWRERSAVKITESVAPTIVDVH
jgi:hypothetical protein